MSAAYGPHCCLARLCLRASSRTTTESPMGSLHEPQTSSEAITPLRYAPLKKLALSAALDVAPAGTDEEEDAHGDETDEDGLHRSDG